MNIKLLMGLILFFISIGAVKSPSKKYEILHKYFSSFTQDNCDHIYYNEFMEVHAFKYEYMSKNHCYPEVGIIFEHAIQKKFYCWLYRAVTNDSRLINKLEECALKKKDLKEYSNSLNLK
ncbi:hypothetical protein M1446_02600 [Candidatus Dependentiae bacterium]|nr:hypothetical protein [Candidatus Dependentiae bacterium]